MPLNNNVLEDLESIAKDYKALRSELHKRQPSKLAMLKILQGLSEKHDRLYNDIQILKTRAEKGGKE